jgi:hypothetical protein
MTTPVIPLVLSCGLLLGAFADNARLKPAAAPQQWRDIWDYTISRLNPRERDYGAELEQARESFIRERLYAPRSWFEFAGAAMLVVASVRLVHQNHDRRRREIIAAEFLARYHNALVESRQRLAEAISHNETMIRNAAGSSRLPLVPEQRPEVDETSTASIFLGSNFRPRSREGTQKGAPKPVATPESAELRANLATRIEELERQLSASQQRETILQKQLAKLPRQRSTSSGTLTQASSTTPGKGTT